MLRGAHAKLSDTGEGRAHPVALLLALVAGEGTCESIKTELERHGQPS